MAASWGRTGIIAALLDANASCNCWNWKGKTALQLAIDSCCSGVTRACERGVTLLMAAGAKLYWDEGEREVSEAQVPASPPILRWMLSEGYFNDDIIPDVCA